VPSFTLNVATPLAFVTALAGEIVELPEPAVRVTVFPDLGLPHESFNVTVIVEVVLLSAATEAELAVTVDVAALTAPAVTVSVAGVEPMLRLFEPDL
jgi:hypothetical protein